MSSITPTFRWAAQYRWIQKQREEGRCRECHRHAKLKVDGTWYARCAMHIEKSRQKQRRRYEFKTEFVPLLCHTCHQPVVEWTRTGRRKIVHQACEARKTYPYNCHPDCHNRASKVWQQRQKAAGNCVSCGQKREFEDVAHCLSCLKRYREKRGCVPWRPGGLGRVPREELENRV